MNNTKYDTLNASELEEISNNILSFPSEKKIESLDEVFQSINPRCIFLKNLGVNSELLDLGAGDGSLSIFKEWPLYKRLDIKMHALSLDKGVHHQKYNSWKIANFEREPNIFAGKKFDAVVCAHFIEHMENPEQTICFLNKILNKNGEVYIEWPHEISKKMPSREKILKNGISISTTNFYDDKTHICPWDSKYVLSLFEKNGFYCRTIGRVFMPYLAEEMIYKGVTEKNIATTTLGYWAFFGWAQYMILFKK
jgi:ubiquinone/menaquinone biosynthesis C-methylase UbiE